MPGLKGPPVASRNQIIRLFVHFILDTKFANLDMMHVFDLYIDICCFSLYLMVCEK